MNLKATFQTQGACREQLLGPKCMHKDEKGRPTRGSSLPIHPNPRTMWFVQCHCCGTHSGPRRLPHLPSQPRPPPPPLAPCSGVIDSIALKTRKVFLECVHCNKVVARRPYLDTFVTQAAVYCSAGRERERGWGAEGRGRKGMRTNKGSTPAALPPSQRAAHARSRSSNSHTRESMCA